MESIWSQTTDIKSYPPLTEDLSADAVVIGGGLAGILTAYLLKQHNIDTIVLEAKRVGGGQTRNSTAKITSQHDIIYTKLIDSFGEELASQYAKANETAIRDYKQLIEKQSIDCSFEELPAYLYSQNQEDVQRLQKEAEAAKRLGIDAEYTRDTALPFSVAGAVRFNNQAQFHPLEFLKAISEGLKIYEDTRVTKVEDNVVSTNHGKVKAKHIVFATHFPFINMPGFYFARMHQERSYVIALKGAARLDGMYYGVDEDGLSLRCWNDILLFGGGGHRTGENSAGGKYAFLRTKAQELIPQGKEVACWSAQDCITLDGVPYIGQFAASTEKWYVATGFAKWGISTSMAAANIITDMILGRENPYSQVFAPGRFTPSASTKQFITDLGQSVKGLARQAFTFPDEQAEKLPAESGGVVEIDGEKVGVYKDENRKLHIVSVRCPHLGCQLEWNPDEKSWDCPCHGSRFDIEGKLLDNPAQINLDKY